MQPRAVIYARYSSEKQREASLEDQIRLCRERAASNGWDVVQVYLDRAMSGATVLRPRYQALMMAAREGDFDILIAEALDRLSRDQEDIAALFKRLNHAGIRIVTLADGEINELHVGLKGTMNALFLKDLRAKTHRGLRGRAEAGQSAGGNAYSYHVLARIGPDSRPTVGEREIVPHEATVIQRIFEAYASGSSPRRIAMDLNANGVPAPRVTSWTSSTINGNRARGTGILNNELYVGRLVWNRLVYAKDPETGRRRSRERPAGDRVVVEVPALRIVKQEIWDAVRRRQSGLGRRQDERDDIEAAPAPFWSKQRPRYLFSGLMRCGVCGGGFSKISATHFGCSTARNKGPTVCANLRTIRRDELETTVLGGLRERLMDPDLYNVFAKEFTREWNRLQGNTAVEQTIRAAELKRVINQIERLVDALADGTPVLAVKGRLAALEQRRLTLEADAATTAAPAPRLHPNLAEVYRRKVAELVDLLQREDAAQAREMVRSLVDHVTLLPEGDGHRVEVRGELAGILALASGATVGKPVGSPDVLAEQMKMVAGTGFEPVTFRL